MARIELKELSQAWSWVALLVVSGFILAMGFMHYFYVADPPRHWDFGALPQTPGESQFSTRTPPRADILSPIQVVPLPEAAPTEAAKRRAAAGGSR